MRVIPCCTLYVFGLLALLSALNALSSSASGESILPEKSCLNYCSNKSICVTANDGPQCYCLPGWMGARCNRAHQLTRIAMLDTSKNAPINPRVPLCPAGINPCQNAGLCLLLYPNQLICACPANVVGYLCEIKQCPDNYCYNGGICAPTTDFDVPPYKCNCSSAYTGTRCETQILPVPWDMCKFLSPYCKNGGTCNMDGGLPACRCPLTHAGNICEILLARPSPQSTQPCDPSPCRNNGLCYPNGNTYFCYCGSRYTGRNCEIPIYG